MAARRTTHRSTKGKKLYAVRSADGKFKDIQTYKRAHAQDLKRKSKAEIAKKAAKKTAKKVTKKAVKKSVKKPAKTVKKTARKKTAKKR